MPNNNDKLVFIFMDGCGPCMAFKPTYEDFKNKHSKSYQGIGLDIIEGNAKDYENKLSDLKGLDVKGFPYVALFKDDVFSEEFQGDRTIEGIIKFLSDNGYKMQNGGSRKTKKKSKSGTIELNWYGLPKRGGKSKKRRKRRRSKRRSKKRR
tara:strand:+ start:435 stop:887 length:453 start_codon:yes stop_codon:yes gene_type:complete